MTPAKLLKPFRPYKRAKPAQTAELIRASQERVRLATEASGLGVWMWEVDTDKVTWEHDRLFELFGLERTEEAINATRFAQEFLHPDDLQKFSESVAAALERGEPFKFKGRILRRPNRQVRWLEFNGALQPAQPGAPRWLLGTAADITDRQKAEETLSSSEERYRALFEAMDEGFCLIEMIFDRSGCPVDYRFLETNPAFQKQSGLFEAVGRTMLELVPAHDTFWFETYGRVVTTGKPERFVSEARALGRWFDVYATRVGGADSNKVAVVFNDISVRMQAEKELRQMAQDVLEADRRKTEFLAMLAHELRNPLAPIRNALEVMRLDAQNPRAVEQARAMMERQVTHLVHLVDDLLDVARITHGQLKLKKEPADLRGVVRLALDASTPHIQHNGQALTVTLPDEPLPVNVDSTRIAQALSNLLNNAAKYTPAGGSVELRAWVDASHNPPKQVLVSVSDNGNGIAPESLESIFDMFTQVTPSLERKHGGLGIGLSVVRQLMSLHGGSVSAASAGVGLGSTFTIALPLADTEQPGANMGAPVTPAMPAMPESATRPEVVAPGKKPEEPKPMKVLVVDDNKDAADSLAMLLELDGHTCLTVYSGPAALQAAPAYGPDLVVLDIGMPEMNGYDVAAALRKIPGLEHVVLIALTGWGAEADQLRSRQAGFDHHLTKPADLAAMDAVLAGLAARRRGGMGNV